MARPGPGLHALGQAADIVMRLDGDGGPARRADAFDDVGIERALCEEFRAADLVGVPVEHVDEGGADDLALLFRIADAFETAEEKIGGLRVDQRDIVMALEQRDDFIRLARAHQSGIDEDTSELIANGFVDQDRGDGGIHAAGETADHLALADLRADLLDLALAEGMHVPLGLDAGDVDDEVLVHLRAARRVDDFGVELDSVELALLVRDHGIGRMFGCRDNGESRRHGDDLVAVVHPHRLPVADIAEASEQRRVLLDLDVAAAEFAVMAAFDLAAELFGHRHLAIADAENGNAHIEHALR